MLAPCLIRERVFFLDLVMKLVYIDSHLLNWITYDLIRFVFFSIFGIFVTLILLI